MEIQPSNLRDLNGNVSQKAAHKRKTVTLQSGEQFLGAEGTAGRSEARFSRGGVQKVTRGRRLQQASLLVGAVAEQHHVGRGIESAPHHRIDGAVLERILSRWHGVLDRARARCQRRFLLRKGQVTDVLLEILFHGKHAPHELAIQGPGKHTDVAHLWVILEPKRTARTSPRQRELQSMVTRYHDVVALALRIRTQLLVLEVVSLLAELGKNTLGRCVGRNASKHRKTIEAIDPGHFQREVRGDFPWYVHIGRGRRGDEALFGETRAPVLQYVEHRGLLAARVQIVHAGVESRLYNGWPDNDEWPHNVAYNLRTAKQVSKTRYRRGRLDHVILRRLDSRHGTHGGLEARAASASCHERYAVVPQVFRNQTPGVAARAVNDDRLLVHGAVLPF